ncbi:MAG: MBL fold metallo-hydrolase [Gemmataceae bacterium]
MKQVAQGIWKLSGFHRHAWNVYLAGDVLIDAGTRWDRGRLLSQLRRQVVRTLTLTHCHPDHQGSAAYLCQRLNIPLACHEADVAAMEGRERMHPRNRLLELGEMFLAGPPHPVDHVLRNGDVIGDFRVVHTPGHTPGHVLYFRESDRTAIVGDLLVNINFLTGRIRVGIPPWFVSHDFREHRMSVSRLLELRPKLVLFGHGPASTDIKAMARFALDG